MLRCDYKAENEHMIEHWGSTKWKTNEKYSAKFILGCKLKFSNYSKAFPGANWLHGFFTLLFAHHVNWFCTVIACA